MQKQKRNKTSKLPLSSASTIKAKRLAAAFIPSDGNLAFSPMLCIGWERTLKVLLVWWNATKQIKHYSKLRKRNELYVRKQACHID